MSTSHRARALTLGSLGAVAATLFALSTLGVSTRADPPPGPPPEIQAIIDKFGRHEPLSGAEQRALAEWTLRKSNGTATRPEDAPTRDQNPGLPKNVQEILARMQAGQTPSAAELARVKAWTTVVAGKRDALARDKEATRRMLEEALARGGRGHASGRDTLSQGTVTLEITQVQGGGKSASETHATITYPVRYLIDEDNSGADRALHIRFFGDTKRTYAIRSQGRLEGTDNGNAPHCSGEHQDVMTWRVMDSGKTTNGKLVLLGEVVVPRGRRGYIDAQLGVRATGPQQISCACGDREGVGPPLLYPITLDALRGDVPFNKGAGNAPIADPGARLMDKAGDFAQVIEAATFAFDADAFRAGMTTGKPFRISGTYAYRSPATGLAATVAFDFDFGAGCDPELVVHSAGYTAWIPEGNLVSPGDKGNTLALLIAVQCKDGRDLPPELQATHMDLELVETSHLPGVAMNWPLEARDDGTFDLRLAKSDRDPRLRVTDPKGQRAEIDGPLAQVVVDVEAYDYGAYGQVKGRADLPDGRHLESRPEDAGVGPMRLPKRDATSKIADAWKKAYAAGQADDADVDDKPEGNGFQGDGLSTFEEYRGFAVGAEHVRTKPKTKDLFIRNEVGASAQAGIDIVKRASELDVHDGLLASQMPASRIINGNLGPGAHIDQHAIRLVAEPPLKEGAEASEGSEVEAIGTPGAVDHITIGPADPGPRGRAEYGSIVAHEIFHDCNLVHHGTGDRTPVRWVKSEAGEVFERAREKNGSAQAVPLVVKAADGRVLTGTDPLVESLFPPHDAWSAELHIAAWNGEHSGDDTCVMRWSRSTLTTSGQYVSIVTDRAEPNVRWIFVGPETIGDTLCDGKAGTGLNAPGRAPRPWHGAALEGNCKKQLVVSDRYRR